MCLAADNQSTALRCVALLKLFSVKWRRLVMAKWCVIRDCRIHALITRGRRADNRPVAGWEFADYDVTNW